MSLKQFLLPLLYSLSFGAVSGQLIEPNASSNIEQSLKKLLTTSSVLYMAAHPDDENTRLISYFANETLSRTAYLSLTRGDGGQNLIGTEKGPSLGLLRTQELLAARRIDGGEQFFTRAIDFGYSKTAKETFEFWNREEILRDVVLVIRKFRPDVIITRFPANEYAGHGHHTASAMLAHEAFEAAADPNRFSDQLENYNVTAWQVKRLYFNASSWWNKDLPELAKNSDDYVSVDIGSYNPFLGLGYGEMAAESRSQHKSQGFGAGRQRGSILEYLQYEKGEKASNGDILSGIPTDWSRYGAQGKEIQKLLSEALKMYDPKNPELAIEALLKVRTRLRESIFFNSNSDGLLSYKMDNLEEIILQLCGIYAEVTMDQPLGVPGEQMNYEITAVNRANKKVKLKTIEFFGENIYPSIDLGNNSLYEKNGPIQLPENAAYSNPYWLNHQATYIYKVDNEQLIGQPEFHENQANFVFEIEGEEISISRTIQYRFVDREKGEIYQPFVVVPAATAEIMTSVIILNEGQPAEVKVKVRNHLAEVSGRLVLKVENGWEVEPNGINFSSSADEGETVVTFKITPPKETSTSEIQAQLIRENDTLNYQLNKIQYDHIPTQYFLEPANASAINLNINKEGKRIGYVMGAGDEIPENLRQIGYEVNILDPTAVNSTDLSTYDAVMIGIRAYNTLPELVNARAHLLNYVSNGGRLIVQYQTSRGIDANDFSPYPLQLSRNRVTDENARVNRLIAGHPIFNSPNKITDADFENWVQERGLYFGGEWDSAFQAPIGWNDEGEDSANGGLLIADYGKGAFIYTGISFFRQLPAGVPGAFRLLANIISYQNITTDEN